MRAPVGAVGGILAGLPRFRDMWLPLRVTAPNLDRIAVEGIDFVEDWVADEAKVG